MINALVFGSSHPELQIIVKLVPIDPSLLDLVSYWADTIWIYENFDNCKMFFLVSVIRTL